MKREREERTSVLEQSTFDQPLDRGADLSTASSAACTGLRPSASCSLLTHASSPWPRPWEGGSTGQSRHQSLLAGTERGAVAEAALQSTSAFAAYQSSSCGNAAGPERGSVEASRRLGHADLIARAREVGRQTEEAIERAKHSLGRSRSDATAFLARPETSRSSRDNGLISRDVGPSEQDTMHCESRLPSVLASTLAVEALRTGDTARMRQAESSWDANLRSPRASATPGALAAAALSPRPSRLSSPVRVETHPDLHWGATALHRPLPSREPPRSPRCSVAAYPPSPEDTVRASCFRGSSATASSRSLAGGFCSSAGLAWPLLGDANAAPSQRGRMEGLSPRGFEFTGPLSPERCFSPQPSSSSEHYHVPASAALSFGGLHDSCGDFGLAGSPRPIGASSPRPSGEMLGRLGLGLGGFARGGEATLDTTNLLGRTSFEPHPPEEAKAGSPGKCSTAVGSVLTRHSRPLSVSPSPRRGALNSVM